MKRIEYVKGDATLPKGEGTKFVIHCCNDIGGWGRGFVLSINKRYRRPMEEYRRWYTDLIHELATGHFGLGEVQFVPVTGDTIIVNMIGQHGIKKENGIPPIRYDAIESCLQKVREKIHEMMHEDAEKHFTSDRSLGGYSIHCPRFGAGLAGGDWALIELLIRENLSKKEIPVTVYDL